MGSSAPVLSVQAEPSVGETIALLVYLEQQQSANTVHEYANHYLKGLFSVPITKLEQLVSRYGTLYDLERLDLALQQADRLFRFDRNHRKLLIHQLLKDCAHALADAASSRISHLRLTQLAFALEALIKALR